MAEDEGEYLDIADSDFGEFYDGYLEAALWSSTDPDTERPLDDDYGTYDINEAVNEKLRQEAFDFADDVWSMIEDNPAKAGFDFWLTRNGHGSGFWDGGWPKYGSELSRRAKVYGGVDLYAHEGEVYASGYE